MTILPIFVAALQEEGPEELEHLRVRTAYTVAPLEVELDIVPSRFSEGGVIRDEIRSESEVGLGRGWMIELEAAYGRLDEKRGSRREGVSAIELELKTPAWRNEKLRLAVGAELLFPAALDGEWGTGIFSAVSLRFSTIDIHGEIALEAEAKERPESEFAAAIVGDILGLWRWNLAINGELRSGRAPELLGVLGVEVRPGETEISFGLGVFRGLTTAAPDWGIVLDFEVES